MSITDSETLKHQFQLIQEQQQKKLFARKQKKLNNSAKDATLVSKNDCLGVEDDLELKLDSKVPDDEKLRMFSELDEIKQANRVLKDENGRLYKLLGERDEEMRIIRKQRDSERKALAGTGVAADTAAGKIVELSKKNRELTAELQSEKNKARQLAKQVQDLEIQAAVLTQPNITQVQAKNDKAKLEETKELQEKLKSANSKMTEYRNQCESLKKEIKVANKVLSKELGEHVNVAAILNEPSGWRGRQQQISALQNKVTELKGQLHEVARCGSTTSSNFLLRSSMVTPSVMSSQHNEKHKSVLRKIEKDRKETLEKTQDELGKMTEDHTRLQQKLEASKARNKVLANELKSVKAQIKTLMEKGAHDDELIAALMREQEHLKQSSKKTVAPQPQVIVTQDTAMINHLKQLCQQHEQRIKELEKELQNTEQNLRQQIIEKENIENTSRPDTANAMCSTEDLQPRPPPVLREQNLHRTQSPATRDSRVGYGQLPPTPPSAGRHSRGRRSSASNSEEMHVLRCQVQELKSTCQVAEVERDRLLELVAVLQKRNEEEKSTSLQITAKLQEQRRMNAHMEKQLGRAQSSQTLKSTNHSTKFKGRGSLSRISGEDSEVPQNIDKLDELRTWLEIQKDENGALKEALNSTLKAKEEDLKFYHEMIEQTKKVFLQGLRQFRQNSAPS